MSTKPSYIGLLNAIAVAETEAEGYFCAWAAATPSAEVRAVLQTVGLREGEHGKAFAKRLCELGFEMRQPENPGLAEKLEIAGSTELSDREKFERLSIGQDKGDGPDFFDNMFKDKTIDIQTGALLGRYIAEERDSGRLLRGCYGACVAAEAGSNGHSANGASSDIDARLGRLEGLVEQVLAKIG